MQHSRPPRQEIVLNGEGTLRHAMVRVGPMVNIAGLLRGLGCEPGPVFASAGFRAEEFIDTEHRISYSKCSQLLANCAAATACDHFGLLLGQMAGPSHLGIAGFLLRTASTVGEALRSLEKNLDLHDEGGNCKLSVEDDYSCLSYSIHLPGIAGLDQVYDLSAVIMHATLALLCGNGWKATQVLMQKSRPDDITPYAHQFRTTVLFDSEICGIVFPSQYLGLTPLTADQFLHHHLELEAETLHHLKGEDIHRVLPLVLQRGLLHRQYSAGQIADALKMHERTLHRRLKSVGTSFRHELDAARESLCKQLLESSDRPVGDIATSVGYADSSGFVRAFHRWTGVTPAAWRKQNGGPSAH